MSSSCPSMFARRASQVCASNPHGSSTTASTLAGTGRSYYSTGNPANLIMSAMLKQELPP